MQMLSTPLYPYQEEGMLHLTFQGRDILSDEMGLGKTTQAIAAAEFLRRLHNIQRVLVVIYSLRQVVNPQVFGPLFKFNRQPKSTYSLN